MRVRTPRSGYYEVRDQRRRGTEGQGGSANNRIGCTLLPSPDHRMRPRASQGQDDLHGNMHELDKVSDESHDGESDGYGSTELDVFYEGARFGSGQPGRGRRWYGARPGGWDLPFCVGLVHRLMNCSRLIVSSPTRYRMYASKEPGV